MTRPIVQIILQKGDFKQNVGKNSLSKIFLRESASTVLQKLINCDGQTAQVQSGLQYIIHIPKRPWFSIPKSNFFAKSKRVVFCQSSLIYYITSGPLGGHKDTRFLAWKCRTAVKFWLRSTYYSAQWSIHTERLRFCKVKIVHGVFTLPDNDTDTDSDTDKMDI